MLSQQNITILVQIILIIAAINWGVVAYNNTDIVKLVTNGGDIEKYVKYGVGIAGVYSLYIMYMSYTK
jgi:uncharacterized membrane protein YuzA (DUF378 family)